MRTTLTIDDDILSAAKAMAVRRRMTIGEVVSDLARQSLTRVSSQRERDGIPLLPVTNPTAIITLEMVNSIRDD